MKNSKQLYRYIALLLAVSSVSAYANDELLLGDDQEMPDPLLQMSDPDKNKVHYGDENIVISGDGAKNNAIIKADPLLTTIENKKKSTEKDIKLKDVVVTEQDKAIEYDDLLLKTADGDSANKKQKKNDELEMPDPLLDSFN